MKRKLLALALAALSLTGCSSPQEPAPPEEIKVVVVALPTSEPVPVPDPEPEIEPAEHPYKQEAEYLAKTIWGEARGCSVTEQAAVAWCILNRVDSPDPDFPDDIISVITEKNQFHGYKADYPVTDEHFELALDVIDRWLAEKDGESDVGRVLPAEYTFFRGDGKRNIYRDAWSGNYNVWDWSLSSPYEGGETV